MPLLIKSTSFTKKRQVIAVTSRHGIQAIETAYARRLRSAVDAVFADRLAEILDGYESGILSIDSAQNMATAFQQEAERQLSFLAQDATFQWFQRIDKFAANKFTSSIKNAMGIDAQSILSQSIYDELLETGIAQNVSLIRNLSPEAYQDVRKALLADFQGVGLPGDAKSLSGAIKDILGSTKRRASVIARDQTAKMNSQMAQERQVDAGVTYYQWRTAGDQRVVGNPSGLYPKGNAKHMNHFDRNGKIFAWNDPPSDGHPGEAIMCRCIALAVLNPRKMKIQEG